MPVLLSWLWSKAMFDLIWIPNIPITSVINFNYVLSGVLKICRKNHYFFILDQCF